MSRGGGDLSRAPAQIAISSGPDTLYHRAMEREVILVRDGQAVWRGFVQPPASGAPAAARDYLDLAWRKALADGAVTEADAGRVVFRFP
jgi:hypothetical protein